MVILLIPYKHSKNSWVLAKFCLEYQDVTGADQYLRIVYHLSP